MPTDTIRTLKLPEGYSLADLKLRRCESDAIDPDMDMNMKLVCKIDGFDFQKTCQNPGPAVATIPSVWQTSHLAGGGQPEALMLELKAPGQSQN